jgi:hypothetical protein
MAWWIQPQWSCRENGVVLSCSGSVTGFPEYALRMQGSNQKICNHINLINPLASRIFVG